MVSFLYEWALTILASALVIITHDKALKYITNWCKYRKMIWVMLFVSIIHVSHIWIYAIALYIGQNWMNIGEISGCDINNIADYVYFSATNYTSLGYGDCIATGGLRLLATFSGLIGLLMIGWSTAFAFWWMQRNWLSIDNAE